MSLDTVPVARIDGTTWYTGAGIVEDVHDLVSGFRSGSWIDQSLGGVATSLDLLGACVDPLGTVASWGVSWLLEHVKPLSDALDWLAGDPDQIAAYAQTWRNIAETTGGGAQDLRRAVAAVLAGWQGTAADSYGYHTDAYSQALAGLGEATSGIAMIVEGAGLLVALVRGLVRDLIAEFVSVLAVRLPEWLTEEGLTLGVATPWVVAQISALVAKWTAKIARLLHGLTASVRRLMPMLRNLGDLLTSLKGLLRTLRRDLSHAAVAGQPAPIRSAETDLPPLASLSSNTPLDSPGPNLLAVDASSGGGTADLTVVPGGQPPDLPNDPGANPDPLHAAADRSVDISAIIPEPVWRTSDEPLWRFDDRPPSVIFANGFQPWDATNTNLARFVHRGGDAAFVSTTRNGMLDWYSPYRYEIRAPGGIEVDATLGRVVFPGEAEIAFPGGIASRFIAGAHRIDPTGVPISGSWIPNPYFQPG
jgi:uncharacterized protein YukE